MRGARCILGLLAAGPLLASAAVAPGAAPGAAPAAPGTAATTGAQEATALPRPAWLPMRGVQEAEIAAALDEETLWVEAADTRFLLVQRPPLSGAGAGSVLFLVDATSAPDARSRSALLRRGLARHGWHTFFARLPEAPVGSSSAAEVPSQAGAGLPVLQALLDAVRSAGPGRRTVLVAEGPVGHRVAALAPQLDLDGLVLLNLPDPRVPRPVSHAALASLSLPALLLQESPLDWDPDLGLGPGVELQRLPPGAAAREDDRVLRRIRGWLQRRLTG